MFCIENQWGMQQPPSEDVLQKIHQEDEGQTSNLAENFYILFYAPRQHKIFRCPGAALLLSGLLYRGGGYTFTRFESPEAGLQGLI